MSTYDNGEEYKEQQIDEFVAPASDPLEACSADEELELRPSAWNPPIAALLSPDISFPKSSNRTPCIQYKVVCKTVEGSNVDCALSKGDFLPPL